MMMMARLGFSSPWFWCSVTCLCFCLVITSWNPGPGLGLGLCLMTVMMMGLGDVVNRFFGFLGPIIKARSGAYIIILLAAWKLSDIVAAIFIVRRENAAPQRHRYIHAHKLCATRLQSCRKIRNKKKQYAEVRQRCLLVGLQFRI